MNKFIIICMAVLGLQACQNTQDYKAVRQEVMDAHDKVMMDGEIAITNKMKLDTLAGRLDSLKHIKVISDTLVEKQKINAIQLKLNHADDQMNDWMHKFDAELGSKSNEEAVLYFRAEKEKVNALDSLYKAAISESNTYLSRFKKR
jgi:hypothetical protein